MSAVLETPGDAPKADVDSPASSRRGGVSAVEMGELATSTPRVLGPYFRLAAGAPWVVRLLRPVAVRLVPLVSGAVRRGTRRNAARIFGRDLGAAESRAFSRAVVESFHEFVEDVGRSSRETAEDLRARIERVEGEEAYRSLRGRGAGAVLVTAHMGSFEVGLAALARVERRVHVVYKRDASGAFELMRAAMRRRLGVVEAPIDDGLGTWMGLRDALLKGDVVVMQADRAMPGQRSEVVPFLHGHLRVPTGFVRLARMTGSPIVPVFTVRLASGRFAVHLCPSIDAGAESAVREVAKAIEKMVAAHPAQWLVLGAAFEEDAAND